MYNVSEEKISDRNVSVEFLRVLFTFVICLHHFRMYSDSMPYGGGYIAVDFFFIISGYYTAEHFRNFDDNGRRIRGGLAYLLSRYRRLIGTYIISFFLEVLCRIVFFKEKFLGTIRGYVCELFMLEIGGNSSKDRINPPDWYCGILLIATVILVIIIVAGINKIPSPFYLGTACFIYAVLFYKYGHVNIYPQYVGIAYMSIFRGLAGLMTGTWLNRITGKTYHGEKRNLSLISIVLLIWILYMTLWDNAYSYTDYLVIAAFIFVFYTCILGYIQINNEKLSKTILLMGRISYSIYLNHYLVALIFSKTRVFCRCDWKLISAVYLFCVILVSAIVYYIVNKIGKYICERT